MALPKARPPIGVGPKSLDVFPRVQERGLVAVERGLGSGRYPGNSSSLLPAAHCTSAFPSTKANSQSWAAAQGWSKITCMAQSLCQLICQSHTDFLFSSPHPSLLALSWQGWHTAHKHKGHLRCICQNLVANRELWSSGLWSPQPWGGQAPKSPSPRTGLISGPLHSQKRSESTTEAVLRGNFQSPLPTSCLPRPCTEGPILPPQGSPHRPNLATMVSRQHLLLCTAGQT